MPDPGIFGTRVSLSFNEWRARFFADAQTQGLLHNAESLNDIALRLFWRDGVAPSVRALLESTSKLSRDHDRPESPKGQR